jgi:hypothetical protein
MGNPDQSPGLAFYLPVINIEDERVSRIRDRVAEGVKADSKVLRKVFKPAKSLRADIATRQEIVNLQGYAGLGETDVDEEHLEELEEYITGVVPETFLRHVIDTPTFPVRMEPTGRGLAVSIAGSVETMQVRTFVKGALSNFYNLRRVPDAVWLDDERATRPLIARSYGPGSNGLARHLYYELNCDDTLLPERTEFGGLTPGRSPSPGR